jgi:hypothetical protein
LGSGPNGSGPGAGAAADKDEILNDVMRIQEANVLKPTENVNNPDKVSKKSV